MFILDIETKPQENLVDLFNSGIKPPSNYKDQDKIDSYIEKKKEESKKGMSIDPDYADILCIGVRRVGSGITKIFDGDLLKDVLTKIGNDIIITYNGKGFDFPLMIKYGIKHTIDIDYQRLKAGTKKYSSNLGHIDLMEELCGGKFKTLDELLQIYLDISKKPIDFATATDEEIKAHCEEDLENTEKLYIKFKPLFV